MVLFIPQLINGEPNKIFKIDLLNTINKMAIKMEEEEFDKLWKKFDSVNSGFVKSEDFLKRLGIINSNTETNNLDESLENFEALKSNRDHPPMSIPLANVDTSKITLKLNFTKHFENNKK